MSQDAEESSLLLAKGTYFLGVLWLLVLVGKGFVGRPVLYHVHPEVTAEGVLALGVAALLLLALVVALVKHSATGSAGESFTLTAVAPSYFVGTIILWVLWVQDSPSKSASYVPLGVLAATSFVATYLWHFGFLKKSRVHGRTRQLGPNEAGASNEQEPARLEKPRKTFASIHGNQAVKDRLKEAGTAIVGSKATGASPRNGILLHGGPGDGKTSLAEAFAGELGLPLLQLTYADVASEWVGKKSAGVRAAFAQAIRHQPCVFFIDEADSFIESRDGGGGPGVKEDRDLVNAMLTLMVDIRKHKVVLVAATNHLDRLDSAGVREGRFDFKIEIPPPDLPARIGLLKDGLRANAPKVHVPADVIETVAGRWNGFSAKRILAVTEELPSHLKGRANASFADFMGALRTIQGQRGAVLEDVKPLADLVFSPRTRDLLEQIVGRMADPEHTERHGGTLPTGILFSGPPGTGKTAASKAMAKEIGWAFLPATGGELSRDVRKLEALHAKAKELRPAIIFVDEGDELLRSRDFSSSTESTNKLLTLMDGVNDRVRDVVWIAATNNPDQIDAALLRGGRFTEKVVFELPSAPALASHVVRWLEKRKVQLEEGFSASKLATLVEGRSIADAEAIAQSALNRAISRRAGSVIVTEADARQAVQTVLG